MYDYIYTPVTVNQGSVYHTYIARDFAAMSCYSFNPPTRFLKHLAEWTLGWAASLCGSKTPHGGWVTSAHQQPGGHCPRCLAAAFVDGALGARVCTMFFAGLIREEDLCYGVVTGSGVTCWRR